MLLKKMCKACGRELKLAKKYMRNVSCIHCLEPNSLEKEDMHKYRDQIAKEW